MRVALPNSRKGILFEVRHHPPLVCIYYGDDRLAHFHIGPRAQLKIRHISVRGSVHRGVRKIEFSLGQLGFGHSHDCIFTVDTGCQSLRHFGQLLLGSIQQGFLLIESGEGFVPPDL